MEKRYQVFISSTFTDLRDERHAALKAVLELDHMPAGMELFPAADENAWQLIQDVIKSSDYYVLIVGGRYGSLDGTGLSYTEKEYEYASSLGKPVISLLHEKPGELPRDKTDIDEGSWQKLQSFRGRIEKNHACVYWNSAEQLKGKLMASLVTATKRSPQEGWVRAGQLDVIKSQQTNGATSLSATEPDSLARPPRPHSPQQEQGFRLSDVFPIDGRARLVYTCRSRINEPPFECPDFSPALTVPCHIPVDEFETTSICTDVYGEQLFGLEEDWIISAFKCSERFVNFQSYLAGNLSSSEVVPLRDNVIIIGENHVSDLFTHALGMALPWRYKTAQVRPLAPTRGRKRFIVQPFFLAPQKLVNRQEYPHGAWI